MIENGTATPGISVAERLRRNRKITITTRQIVSTSVNSTSWIEPRMDSRGVERDREIDRRAESPAGRLRQQLLDVVDDLDGVGAGLALDREDDAARRR